MNLFKFNTKKAGPNFLTSGTREAFNYLRFAFTKALIFEYFDLKCHIWIETHSFGYTISEMLNQLTFETSHNRVVIKTNLG